MVENPDSRWAKETFGTKAVALFKPVTHELFADLGEDWKAYDGIYDPKTKITDAHKRRLIEAAKLVSHASDAEFERRFSEFFESEEFARFVAVNSLLSSYDGFFSNGQNFLMYLDPHSGPRPRVGRIRVHRHAGAARDGQRHASIWVGDNRLLERGLAVDFFRRIYRAELERIFNTLFDPQRLAKRVDELAAVIRPTVEEESDYRRGRFAQAITDAWSRARDGQGDDPLRPVHQLKRFFVKRAESVNEQLAGKSEGHVFRHRHAFDKRPETSQ